MEAGNRVLQLFDFCFKNGLDCGISWFNNQFVISVTQNGNIISSAEEQTLTAALDACANGFRSIGWN